MKFRITNKWGSTLGYIKEVDYRFLNFLLLPLAPIFIVGILGGVIWLSFTLVSFLLSTLSGFGTGDVMSYEIAGLCIATLIAWVIGYFCIVFAKDDDTGVGVAAATGIIPLRNIYI